jgi:glycosyltransferase involved in cell wall biosynthesis
MINYVPVLAEGMRGGASGKRDAARGMRYGQLSDGPVDRAPVRSIYHCVDRWDQFDMYDSAMMTEMDRRCCVYADLVIASSTDLYTRCRRLNPNTVMITHGVDWEHFRQAASGMREEGSGKRQAAGGEPHPVIGFFGLLSEWVDQELILKLAAEFSGATHPLPLQGGEPHPLIPAQGVGSAPALIPSLEGQGVGSSPRADIVLIGKADVPVTRLQGIANIHLLGPKPFAELPSHIARFTVGVIPFVVNDLTRAVNPIKLREMLAAGCPVVSSALPEVEKFEKRGSVFVAHNADEFVAMVREAIAHPLTTEQRLALSDSMASETWAGKVEEILKLVARGEP